MSKRQVWKFPLVIEREQTLLIPAPWEPMTIAMQGGTPCLWAMVNPEGEKRPERIVMVGTGHAIPDEYLERLGSVIDGPYVWHFFRAP